MSYVRFQAPVEENAVQAICAKLREASVSFSGVKLDKTAPQLAVVRTSDAPAVKQALGL